MKKHFIPFFLMLLFSAGVWAPILQQTLRAEGYVYFYYANIVTHSGFKAIWEYASRYDFGVILLNSIFMVIFRDNLWYYQAFVLATAVAVAGFIYLFLFELTQKKSIAIITSLLFTTGLTGYGLYAVGDFTTFIQREVPFLFILPSLIYFIKFLRKEKRRHYLISLLLYIAGYIYCNFSFFFLPLFVLYALSAFIFKGGVIKVEAKHVLFLIPYILVSYLLLHPQRLDSSTTSGAATSLIACIRGICWNLDFILRQLVVVTIPVKLLNFFAQHYGLNADALIKKTYLWVALFYASSTLFSFVKEKKLRPLILTSLLYLLLALVLNVYLRSPGELIRIDGGNRNLHIAQFGTSIFWALVFWTILSKSSALKFIGSIFFVWILYLNISVIRFDMQAQQHEFTADKDIQAYVKAHASTFLEDSQVILPKFISPHAANFYQMFYGKKETLFFPIYEFEQGYRLNRAFNPNRDVILTYDFIDMKIINKTTEYKQFFLSQNIASY